MINLCGVGMKSCLVRRRKMRASRDIGDDNLDDIKREKTVSLLSCAFLVQYYLLRLVTIIITFCMCTKDGGFGCVGVMIKFSPF